MSEFILLMMIIYIIVVIAFMLNAVLSVMFKHLSFVTPLPLLLMRFQVINLSKYRNADLYLNYIVNVVVNS